MNAKKNNATATNDLPNPGTNESIANWVNDGPYSTPGKYSIGYGYYFLGLVSWMILLIVLYILKFIDSSLKRKRSGHIILKIEDGESLPPVLALLDEMEVESNKLTIKKKDNTWVVNFTIIYKGNTKISEIAKLFCDLDQSISIDYCSA